MLKVAICDDDLMFANEVIELIKNAFEQQGFSEVKCIAYDSGDAIRLNYIGDEIDIVFMDIECGNESGFDIAKDLYTIDNDLAIIYMTNHPHYITKAFVCRPLGFVCKSDLAEDLAIPIINATEFIERKKQKIVIYDRKVPIEFIIGRIKAIEIFDHVMEIVYNNNERIRVYSSLGKYEKELENRGFIKISRSVVVNSKYIKKIEQQELVLCDGEKYQVSRERSRYINKHWLAKKVR